jgi:hypothetical protein
MSNWTYLNKHRIRSGHFASDESYGFNGAFQFSVPGEARRVCCVASDGLGWQHVSVSFGPNKSIPSWKVMCYVRDLFWEPDQWVVQFHPPTSEYVNNHPGCLHLWRSTEAEQPVPDAILVGLKGVTLK